MNRIPEELRYLFPAETLTAIDGAGDLAYRDDERDPWSERDSWSDDPIDEDAYAAFLELSE